MNSKSCRVMLGGGSVTTIKIGKIIYLNEGKIIKLGKCVWENFIREKLIWKKLVAPNKSAYILNSV